MLFLDPRRICFGVVVLSTKWTCASRVKLAWSNVGGSMNDGYGFSAQTIRPRVQSSNYSACRDFHSGVPGRGIDTCAALLDLQRRTGTRTKNAYGVQRIPLFIADRTSKGYFDRE